MRKSVLKFNLIVCLVSITSYSFAQQETKNENISNRKTIEFKSSDGVDITADLYSIENVDAPFILLCHQAGFSRGEYLEIAPKLNKLGFNCLAIDQRSGQEANGIKNQTTLSAKSLGKERKYANALVDIESAIDYSNNELKAKKLIVWGSSYSAALTFVIGETKKDMISGIVAFSPGEYMKVNDRKIKDYAKNVSCPVFITSAKNEEASWQPFFELLSEKQRTSFLPKADGKHGSKALWEEHEGNESYWSSVTTYLNTFK